MNSNCSLGIGLAAVAVFTIVLTTPPTASATEVTPRASWVTADIPGEVTSESETRHTIAGDVTHYTLTGYDGDAELSITATTLPGVATALTTDRSLLRKARRELLKTYGASHNSWTKCSFKASTCRLLKYRTDDGRTGLAQMMLKDGVLVVLNAVYEADVHAAQSFIASAK